MDTSGPVVSRVVVGVDGSEQSRAALDWAIAMARPSGAEIVAVHAIQRPSYAYSYPYAAAAQLDPELRELITREFEDTWCAPLRACGLPFRTVLEDGRPATALAAVADRVGADVIMVGRRGRGELSELLLGSVSHELSHHCRLPVLMVTTPPVARQAAKVA
jgi:nucleotide-binding universal stress UspA family protein